MKNINLQLFAGRNYMVRSQRRPTARPASNESNRPPRRRRRRAGFFYMILMMLLLIILWPAGLLMLWQRKVRWGAGTKLLTSVVTLGACIVLFGFALTVNTGNPTYTTAQDSINTFLNHAADTVSLGAGYVSEAAVDIYDRATELGSAAAHYGKDLLADGLDSAVAISSDVRVSVFGEPEPTATPEPTPEVPGRLCIVIPEESVDPAQGIALTYGRLTGEGKMIPIPTATPAPTVYTIKNPADATVYFNNNGKSYHMTSSCGKMSTAQEHKLSDIIDTELASCELCNTPDRSVMETEHIIWADENDIIHLTDECPNFSGQWKLMTAESAQEAGMTGCSVCRANDYLIDLRMNNPVMVIDPYAQPTETPTAEPTPEPTPEPTAEPTTEPTTEPTPEPTEVPTEESEPEEDAATAVSVIGSADGPTAIFIADKSGDDQTAEPDEETESDNSAEDVDTIDASSEDDGTTDNTVSGADEPTEEPSQTPTPEPTPAATPEPVVFTVKSAADLTVFYAENGNEYHAAADCAKATDCKAHTFGEAAKAGLIACGECKAPAVELLEEPHIVWIDQFDMIHTTDGCSGFMGEARLKAAEKAVEEHLDICPDCGAQAYIDAVSEGMNIALVTPEPTATPIPVAPTTDLKSAGEATVYHSDKGRYYHTSPKCGTMKHGKPFTLADSIKAGFKCCPDCGAPAADLADTVCMWQDEQGLCHTSDSCESFSGKCSLLPREEAIAQNAAACTACEADQYMIPGTVLADQ